MNQPTPSFSALTSWENLWTAYGRASKGKRGQANVAHFEHRLEDNLCLLQDELQSQSYQPGAYVNFYIHEPKRRLISAAPFRDRVVHHALCQQIEPLFERLFIAESFANRVGKGSHRALDLCQQLARKYPYVWQGDVRQYFPSIDHAILFKQLEGKIKDPQILWLAELVLQSGAKILSHEYEMVWFPGDDLLAAARPRGLPIGNLTSQFWANVYLHPFDQFVKRTLSCPGYVRYVDDFLLFAPTKKELWGWREKAGQFLEKCRLTLHPSSHPRPVVEGITFLGFIVFPQKRQLKNSKGFFYKRQLTKMIELYRTGLVGLSAITQSVQGWINHVRYANSIGLRKALLGRLFIPKPLT